MCACLVCLAWLGKTQRVLASQPDVMNTRTELNTELNESNWTGGYTHKQGKSECARYGIEPAAAAVECEPNSSNNYQLKLIVFCPGRRHRRRRSMVCGQCTSSNAQLQCTPFRIQLKLNRIVPREHRSPMTERERELASH